MSILTWLKTTSTRASSSSLLEETTTDDTAIASTSSSSVPVVQTEVDVTSSQKDTESETHVLTPAKGVKRKLNERWLTDYSWCEFKEGKLFCSTCIVANSSKHHHGQVSKGAKVDSRNKFITGSTNLQKSALDRHQQSDDHRLSVIVLKQREAMGSIKEKVKIDFNDSVMAQVRTAIVLAAEDIPDTKFIPLLELQKKNGVPALQSEGMWYRNHNTPAEMQAAAADVCSEAMKLRLQSSRYIGIMIDESLDMAVQKKLVIYFQLCSNENVPCVQFGANIEVRDGKAPTIVAAVRNYLQDIDIPLNKVVGLGSDGASVMLGSKTGVATVLKRLNPSLVHVWCCAHRLALVAHWAANAVHALKKLESTLVSIYKFFKWSAVRYNALREMKQVMNEKVRRFKKPTSVRWRSLMDAVVAVHSSWGCLVLSLEDQATRNDTAGDTTALATALLKEIKTFKFIACLCVLLDALEVLTKCSKFFQRDTINIDESTDMLNATMDSISSLPDGAAQKT